MMDKPSLENLYAKISRYCAYQERSSGEVRPTENKYAALLQRTITEKGPKTALSRGFEPSLIRFSE